MQSKFSTPKKHPNSSCSMRCQSGRPRIFSAFGSTQYRIENKKDNPYTISSSNYLNTGSSRVVSAFPNINVTLSEKKTQQYIPRMVMICKRNELLKEEIRRNPWKYYPSQRQVKLHKPSRLVKLMVNQFFPY